MTASERRGWAVVTYLAVPASSWAAWAWWGGDYWVLWPPGALVLAVYVAHWCIRPRWGDRPRERLLATLRRGLCHVCGYDLTGNQSGVCPECGTPRPIVRW